MHHQSPAIYRQITVDATAYCLRGGMANGKQVHFGAVATDPRIIPLGSTITVVNHIPNFNLNSTLYAEDTGSAILGNRLDVWMASCHEAIKWGHKTLILRVFLPQHVTRLITHALGSVDRAKTYICAKTKSKCR